VDRYGQTAPWSAVRYFSPDSAVDGVVLDVLLNKAREHRTLGTHVPVPERASVTEAVLNACSRAAARPRDQIQLDLGLEALRCPPPRPLGADAERDASTAPARPTRLGPTRSAELEATDARRP
jgi:hypothetical protein